MFHIALYTIPSPYVFSSHFPPLPPSSLYYSSSASSFSFFFFSISLSMWLIFFIKFSILRSRALSWPLRISDNSPWSPVLWLSSIFFKPSWTPCLSVKAWATSILSWSNWCCRWPTWASINWPEDRITDGTDEMLGLKWQEIIYK